MSETVEMKFGELTLRQWVEHTEIFCKKRRASGKGCVDVQCPYLSDPNDIPCPEFPMASHARRGYGAALDKLIAVPKEIVEK